MYFSPQMSLASMMMLTTTSSGGKISSTAIDYGVDVSFPVHYNEVSTNYAWLPHNVDPENNPIPEKYKGMPVQPLPGRKEFYDDFMRGCRAYHGKKASACDDVERDRLAMSLRQPQSMVNYTDTGFKKVRAPEKLFKILSDYWEKNKESKKEESWFAGSTYVNHWRAPTYMVSVEDTSLRGGGSRLKQSIWDAAKDTLEEWTGQELTQCSLYGIRVYTEGAVLAPHADRLPLVSSAIINVAQDIDEDWPIEVYGRDGKAYNVTMKPGDMVLYESHSLVHGRPFPLKGRFFANIFIHFEPVGHSLHYHGLESDNINDDVEEKYSEAVKNGHGGHEAASGSDNGLPFYILKNSPEEKLWMRRHPSGQRNKRSKPNDFSTGSSTVAHRAAQDGDVETLSKLAASDKKSLFKKDRNGWQPLHEASRGGHVDVVALLISYGVDMNARTNFDKGGTALWWAEKEYGREHEVTRLLRENGALSISPDEL